MNSDEKKITIIIPFLNEKNEVENTIESILLHSIKNQVDIILINDASDDEFDYMQILKKYEIVYVTNKTRIGVAASRDLGVRMSKTPYVMFLDAHMRFYENTWINRIVYELEKSPRSLLCCQTRGLFIVEEKLIENKKRQVSFGSYIDTFNEESLFENYWIFKKDAENLNTISIPCVLGAAYACRRDYWLYLKGLQGLIYYGNDESYISIKVWLEGGSCKLLKDVFVGHLYRDTPPYIIENAPRLYNRLLIAELLDINRKKILFSYYSFFYKEIFNDSIRIMYKNREEISKLKDYYKEIFQYDFSYYEKINNQYFGPENIISDKNALLINIAQHVILNNGLSPNIGLFNGKLGIVIFLFHYSRYSNNDIYSQFAEKILDDILDNINKNMSFDFHDGLLGIGWGIEYLYQNGFIQGDTNEILEEIDIKVNNIGIESVDDLSFNNGLGGIMCYILSRLYTIEKENKPNPFKLDFLSMLYKKVKCILEDDKNSDSFNIFINSVVYFEKLSKNKQPSIYDVIYLNIPHDYHFKSFGLDGNAGVGLKLILEN
jgi:glycosyltransferase involved in cell wall biosynthesis